MGRHGKLYSKEHDLQQVSRNFSIKSLLVRLTPEDEGNQGLRMHLTDLSIESCTSMDEDDIYTVMT